MPSENRLLHHRVSQIESDQHRLAEAADQNAQTFSDALKMSEAMSIVLQRVLNDMLAGRARCFGDTLPDGEGGQPLRSSPTPQVDFNSYMREYWLCMLMADFAQWCGTIATHDKPLIETATVEDVHVFGG